MATATLTISSRNYSSWSLRAWLFCQLAKVDVEVVAVPIDDPGIRAELLLLSPTVLTPRLDHDGASVWDTIAIAEYLDELKPEAKIFPTERIKRAHCRSIMGEMHGGFYNMRSALPMNLRARYPNFKVFTGAKSDIGRVLTIWNECLEKYGGKFLFGNTPCAADAMYAPVCSRFITYGVDLSDREKDYCKRVMDWEPMKAWIKDAKAEPEELEELDVEF